jgi:hypothetical protein
MANLLITQGCTGTYSIINSIGDYFNFGKGHGKINHHCRNPNMDPERNISFDDSKLVYLFCNPYDYTLSSFNRGSKFIINHNSYEQCNADYEYFKLNTRQTLIEYLKDPYDAFLYKEHAFGYLKNHDRKYNLLFMKYESLSEFGISPLISFWELNVNSNIYKFKKRKSNWQNETEEVKELLVKKYGDVMEWYESLPLMKEYKRK